MAWLPQFYLILIPIFVGTDLLPGEPPTGLPHHDPCGRSVALSPIVPLSSRRREQALSLRYLSGSANKS